MKLLTEKLKARFEQIGKQYRAKDPLVITKFFAPVGSATWYAIAYYPEDNTCFGYVSGLVPDSDEWGYFFIDELESVKCSPFGQPIERDLFFEECRFSEIIKE